MNYLRHYRVGNGYFIVIRCLGCFGLDFGQSNGAGGHTSFCGGLYKFDLSSTKSVTKRISMNFVNKVRPEAAAKCKF